MRRNSYYTKREIIDILNLDKYFTISNEKYEQLRQYYEITENTYNEYAKNKEFLLDYPDYFSVLEAFDKHDKKKPKSKVNGIYTIPFEHNIKLDNGRYTNYIFHVGGTGSGKTFNAINSFKNGKGKCLYLAPLRLLAWEIYDRMSNENVLCNLITGEEQIINCQTHTSATIETLDVSKQYDIVVIDECFMINNKDRGDAWTNAILNINANEAHIITNEESLVFLIKLLSVDNRQYIINRYERKVPIEIIEPINENYPDKTLLVSFSRKEVLNNFKKFDNVSVLYGNLPPSIKKEQMEKFNKGENKICVCTDVVGMGINLPCNYVIFDDIFKFDGNITRELNSSEIKQIGGRAGRYLLSDKGYISATSGTMLDYIKEQYSLTKNIKFGYIGLDKELFIKFQNIYDNIETTLKYFSISSDFFIPNEYKNLLKLKPIDDYQKLYKLNDKINKLSVEIQYELLNLPVCEYTEDFYTEIVNSINNKALISPIIFNIDEIINDDDLMDVEKNIKELELYNYLTKNFYYFLNHKEYDTEFVDNIINKHIDLIRNYLK